VDTARYIGVNFVNHVGPKAAQIVCWLSIALNEENGLSIVKDLTLYKQLTVSCYGESNISVSYDKRSFSEVA